MSELRARAARQADRPLACTTDPWPQPSSTCSSQILRAKRWALALGVMLQVAAAEAGLYLQGSGGGCSGVVRVLQYRTRARARHAVRVSVQRFSSPLLSRDQLMIAPVSEDSAAVLSLAWARNMRCGRREGATPWPPVLACLFVARRGARWLLLGRKRVPP